MVLVEGLSVNERGTAPIFRGRPRALRVGGQNELPSVAALRHMMRNVRYHDPSTRAIAPRFPPATPGTQSPAPSRILSFPTRRYYAATRGGSSGIGRKRQSARDKTGRNAELFRVSAITLRLVLPSHRAAVILFFPSYASPRVGGQDRGARYFEPTRNKT
jgi:hypothetical protein